ncbi:hypothetical protein [Pseudanabaena sp. FACHB-2040]|uniref:hypothetical protein n=1 Tax=Pseudanabaena sp. FACHB-2040 TaxID=2692859 RepID=UPI0016860A93|nr:hypothetical protein [Pseudanabaena sp. FACHB-2040]MBD2259345.1 hypothetical protein [Pseudanabaena sp. FACHB-2040]
MTYEPAPRPIRDPSYLDVLIPLAVLIVSIGGAVSLFGLNAIDGPVQVALIASIMVAALVILKNGHPWSEINASGSRASSRTPIYDGSFQAEQLSLWSICLVEMCSLVLKFLSALRNGDRQGEGVSANVTLLQRFVWDTF